MAEFENEFFKTVHKLESLIKENKEFDIKLPRVCLMDFLIQVNLYCYHQ